MNDKKKLRRLEHLLRLDLFPIEKIRFPKLCKPELWKGFRGKDAFDEVSKLRTELKMSIEEVVDLGQTLRHEKFKARSIYRGKPIQSRRDNKDVKVGSGGSNRNKVRFPKKCRKTAWKRFYKLFPNLKPEEQKPE